MRWQRFKVVCSFGWLGWSGLVSWSGADAFTAPNIFLSHVVRAFLHCQTRGAAGRDVTGTERTYPPNPSQLIALQLTISVYRKNWIIFTEVLDVKHELYIPYHVIKPVLNRCTPEQLKSIQWKNSYLRADTDELWKNFCVQHLQNCDKHYDDDEAEDGDEIGWQRKFYV